MIACPSTEALRDLLLGSLPGTDADPIRDHLARCAACLGELDRLSDDPELARWVAEGRDSTSEESARHLVRDRVRAARDAGQTTTWGPSGPSMRLEPPDRDGDLGRLGPYRVEAVIGRGGMGVVVRGYDEALQRVVALKVLRPGLAHEGARARFVREARAAARVEHDHIVRIYSVANPEDGPPYLVMEYLDGPTLAEWLRLRGRLAPREAARIAAEVADGLAAAHAAGLIHRDIKPSNILFDKATGRAKIADFGLARAVSRPIVETQEGAISGTPAYMSPEQARGQDDLDARSDLYSLGATLYEALTGELPFRGAPQMVLRQVLADEPKPPRRLNDAVPRDLETVCLKAMAKEPSRRYSEAADFAADLRRWLDGSPIRARPVGPAERSWRLARRHPKVAILAAAFLMASTAGVAGVLWQWRRAEANAREANGYLRKSLDSIDGYFVKVSENRLLDVPNLQPLRKELLLAARDYYEALLRDRANDPSIRVELARARSNLASVVALIGSSDEAIGLYRQSLAEFDRLIAESPSDEAPRVGRLTCLIQLARAQLQGSRLDDSRATYRRLLDEGEALRRERPDALEPLQATYAAHHGLASIAWHQGVEPDRAIADFERAIRVNRQLLDRRPDHPAYLRNLSRTAGMLVGAYKNRGRDEDARAALDQSYRATERLVADHPESQDYRFALANLERQRGLGPLLRSFGLKGPAALAELDRARRAFDRAIALDRSLVRENPRLDSYRIDLIGVLAYSAAVESGAGRVRESLAPLREGRDLASSAANPGSNTAWLKRSMLDILVLTAYAHSEEGRPDEALAALDEADGVYESLTTDERSVKVAVESQDLRLAFARAVILREAGRLSEAVASWDRAFEATPEPSRPLVASLREIHRAEASLGPAPDARLALAAAPLADSECSSEVLSGGTHVLYAKLYALAAPAAADPEARESLDARAVFRLDKAREAGYFRDPRRLEGVEADPAFARLLDRPDYREFRRSMSASVSEGRP